MILSVKNISRIGSISILAPLLFGCANPYALKISAFDETGPQVPAVIQISDPQVYARETLINDRRREAEFLSELIEQSKTVVFEPQLKRELRSVSSTAASLRGSFNPGLGRSSRNVTEIGELDQQIGETNKQIELTQRQRELIELQRQLAAVEAGETPPPASSSNGGQQGGDQPQPQNTQSQTEVAALRSEIESLTARIQTLEAQIAQQENAENQKTMLADLQTRRETATKRPEARLPDVNQIRQASVSADPRDIFRDRQAYREELRAALAEAQLDDAHDLNSNALYRLQFQGTVLPGGKKRKFGVARLTLHSPSLTDEELQSLYLTWLGHINYRANEPTSELDAVELGYAPYLFGGFAGLYKIHQFDLENEKFFDGASNQRYDFTPFSTLPTERSAQADGQALVTADDLLENTIIFAMPPSISEETLRIILNEKEFEKGIADLFSLRNHLEGARVRKWFFGNWSDAREYRKGNVTNYKGEFYEALTDSKNSSPEDSPRSWKLTDQCAFLSSQKYYEKIDATITHHDFRVKYYPLTELGRYLFSIFQNASQSKNGGEAGDIYTAYFKRFQTINALIGQVLEAYEVKFVPTVCYNANALYNDANLLPPQFIDAVTDDGEAEDGYYQLYGGESYAYATNPVELAQRISTISSALNAFEFGLALSGSVPNAGVDLEGAVDYMRAAQGRVEALERQPLVIGFSDRTRAWMDDESRRKQSRSISHTSEQFPQFGWVFGPQVRLDPEKKELVAEQVPQSYRLTADISVPGWWPKADFELETAWVDNWRRNLPTRSKYTEADPIRGRLSDETSHTTSSEYFELNLPLSRANLDGLTDFLAHKTVGSILPITSIKKVTPQNISLCETEVTFLVQGPNLWRSTEAFLNGRRHKQLTVMPDMAGISATFDVVNLPVNKRNDSSLGPAELVLWTRDGPSKAWDLKINAARDEGLKCFQRLETNTAPKLRAQTRVLYADDATSEVLLAVEQGALPSGYHSLTLQVREVASLPRERKELGGTVSDNRTSIAQAFPKALWAQVLNPSSGYEVTKIRAALAHKPYPNAAPQITPASSEIVVYETRAEGQPTVSTSAQALTNINDSIEFVLPQHFAQAYPQFAAGGGLTGVIDGQNIKLSGRFEVSEDGKTANGSFKDVTLAAAVRAQPRKISVKFVGDKFELDVNGKVDLAKTP